MFRIGPRIELGDDGEGGKKTLLSTAVAVLIGAGLIFLGVDTYMDQNQALENPVNVSATVTDTGIDEDSSRRGGIDYQPEITFEYSYEGQQYTSNNMYPGGQEPKQYNVESNAREVVNRYSQGSEITVSVPPENPGEAFIKAKRTKKPLFFAGIGLLFIVLASYQLLKTRYL